MQIMRIKPEEQPADDSVAVLFAILLAIVAVSVLLVI